VIRVWVIPYHWTGRWPFKQRQRDHAAERDQTHRAALFDRLLTDLEQEAS
jgi:hypothetical protein